MEQIYVEKAYEEIKRKNIQFQGLEKERHQEQLLKKLMEQTYFFDEAIDIAFSKEYREMLEKRNLNRANSTNQKFRLNLLMKRDWLLMPKLNVFQMSKLGKI